MARLMIVLSIMVMSIVGMTASSCYGADAFVPREGTIQSLYVRDKDVFASTREGVYKALKSEKQWEKLPIPESMPTGGKFAVQPKPSDIILYMGTKIVIGGVPDAEKKVFGLYRSADSGRHWNLISKGYDFRHVYLHPNGTIYAVVEKAFEIPAGASTNGAWVEESDSTDGPAHARRDLILMSKDNGKNWRDITGSIPVGETIYNIFPDPDHPDLVCLSTNCIRSYVRQSEDENYSWKSERVWVWAEQHETDETFFRRGCGSQTIAYAFYATLNNYFAKGAPEVTGSSAFDIVPEKSVYRLSATEPKIINITVKFLPEDHKVILADFSDSTDMWSIKVVGQGGKRVVARAAAAKAVLDAEDHDAAGAELRKDPRFSTFVVDAMHSHNRSIDIGKLYNFSRPGKYRVQIIYSSMGIADKDKGQWPGYFTGQVFTVVVK